MTRLGENVFQFKYSGGEGLWGLGIPLLPLIPGLVCIMDTGDSMYRDTLGIWGWIIGIPLLVLGITFIRPIFRYFKSGVILDNEKGVIILHKWTYRGPQKFEEIQINEIMGVNGDIDVKTTTKLVDRNSSNAHWQTTESRSYNVVLQGKFGSHSFTLAGKDDWNLFMTLLYDDTDNTDDAGDAE